MWLLLSPVVGLLLASGVAAAFVLSLYLWRPTRHMDRDRKEVIQARIIATMSVSVLCIPLIHLVQWTPPSDAALPLGGGGGGPAAIEWIGFPAHPTSSYVAAVTLPLILTGSLFLGPLVVVALTACQSTSGAFDPSLSRVASFLLSRWREYWTPDESWKTVRNLIVAPVAEEIVFRGCVIALLIGGGWGFGASVLLSPILFGCAHLHHLINHVRARGVSLMTGAIMVTFQLGYTSIFGLYASFILLRTGHLTAAIVAHAFCNVMGFPELSFLEQGDALYHRRHAILACFIAGIILFACGLWPLTDASWYVDGAAPWLLHYQQMRAQGDIGY